MSGNMPPQESAPSVTIDPSMTGISGPLKTIYRRANFAIARENLLLGQARQPHLELSKSAIRETAGIALERAPADKRNAIILGAGGCADIPLEEIVDGFHHTTLVDVTTEQTEKAVANLPSKLLGKVTLKQADVTGSMARMGAVIEEVEEASDFTRFLTTAASGIDQLSRNLGHVDLGNDYSFVSSHLLMSQLSELPLDYFRSYLQNARRHSEYHPEGAAIFIDLLNDFGNRIQLAHTEQVKRMVGREGVLHFADTIAAIHDNEVFQSVNVRAVQGLMTNMSQIGLPQTWQWDFAPNKQFTVLSMALGSPHGKTTLNSRR